MVQKGRSGISMQVLLLCKINGVIGIESHGTITLAFYICPIISFVGIPKYYFDIIIEF